MHVVIDFTNAVITIVLLCSQSTIVLLYALGWKNTPTTYRITSHVSTMEISGPCNTKDIIKWSFTHYPVLLSSLSSLFIIQFGQSSYIIHKTHPWTNCITLLCIYIRIELPQVHLVSIFIHLRILESNIPIFYFYSFDFTLSRHTSHFSAYISFFTAFHSTLLSYQQMYPFLSA